MYKVFPVFLCSDCCRQWVFSGLCVGQKAAQLGLGLRSLWVVPYNILYASGIWVQVPHFPYNWETCLPCIPNTDHFFSLKKALFFFVSLKAIALIFPVQSPQPFPAGQVLWTSYIFSLSCPGPSHLESTRSYVWSSHGCSAEVSPCPVGYTLFTYPSGMFDFPCVCDSVTLCLTALLQLCCPASCFSTVCPSC